MRSQHLADEDRVLIEQVYGHGVSVADVARLSRRPARSLRRQVKNLLLRMKSPLYTFMMGHSDLLPEEVRLVAKLTVLHGNSLRKAAAMSGRSLHEVRQHVQTLRALARV